MARPAVLLQCTRYTTRCVTRSSSPVPFRAPLLVSPCSSVPRGAPQVPAPGLPGFLVEAWWGLEGGGLTVAQVPVPGVSPWGG